MGSAAVGLAPPAPHPVAVVTVSCPEEVDQLLAIQAANAPEALTPEERASQGCVPLLLSSQASPSSCVKGLISVNGRRMGDGRKPAGEDQQEQLPVCLGHVMRIFGATTWVCHKS